MLEEGVCSPLLFVWVWGREREGGGRGGDMGYTTHQVDPLSERVAVDWSFGRGDAEALRQDAAVVGDSRAVPEKAAVAAFDFCVR